MRQAIRRMLDRLVAPQRRGAGYYEFLSRHKMIDKSFLLRCPDRFDF